MVRSMTGFGREQRIIDGNEIIVEIRSVNHRYHEISAKVPRHYVYLEEKLKTFVKEKLHRGKAEVNVTIHNISGKEVAVTVNRGVVESYLTALRGLNKELAPQQSLEDNLSLSDVFRMSDAFTVTKNEANDEIIWKAVREVAAAALEKFVSMREKEGVKMQADILEKLQLVKEAVAEIEFISPECVEKYRAKLFEK